MLTPVGARTTPEVAVVRRVRRFPRRPTQSSTVDDMDDVLAEQIAYYRARAGEYDDWWYRRGRYALPAALERDWFGDVAEAEAALGEFAPAGRVLELACGTGL